VRGDSRARVCGDSNDSIRDRVAPTSRGVGDRGVALDAFFSTRSRRFFFARARAVGAEAVYFDAASRA